MLEIIVNENKWSPPDIDVAYIDSVLKESEKTDYDSYEWIHFICTEPYIDFLQVSVRNDTEDWCELHRFTIHEDYGWDHDEEEEFERIFLKSDYPVFYEPSRLDHIYEYYSKEYPGWHLKRYHTHPERLLDHIHHCMKKNTIKELLYKTGLDELAFRAPKADEVNLLATSPAEIYEVPYRVVKSANCEQGAIMLSDDYNRRRLRELNNRYSAMFKDPLNDAQCMYLTRLMHGDLELPEIYRLFSASRPRLGKIWNYVHYTEFLYGEDARAELRRLRKGLAGVDPVYARNMDRLDQGMIRRLAYFLLDKREDFDRDIRRANRKRDYDWQERDGLYAVRYPQTINDFCREAIYMNNCLLSYLEAYVENETTILFMREEDNINTPFIAIEIHKNRLTQAYHRFNVDCTPEEAKWIRAYCHRHSIDCQKYAFRWDVDMR
jgi:hypothetical protein